MVIPSLTWFTSHVATPARAALGKPLDPRLGTQSPSRAAENHPLLPGWRWAGSSGGSGAAGTSRWRHAAHGFSLFKRLCWVSVCFSYVWGNDRDWALCTDTVWITEPCLRHSVSAVSVTVPCALHCLQLDFIQAQPTPARILYSEDKNKCLRILLFTEIDVICIVQKLADTSVITTDKYTFIFKANGENDFLEELLKYNFCSL